MSTAAHDLKYRPDIDGLRAVAVIVVLLYHVGFSAVPGGFVGVDMFFVISGFLITKIINDRQVQGRFSYVDFYRRRALRILPALGVVLAFVLLVGWRVLPPSDYLGTGKAAVAASTFVSNFYFWRVGGYFDTELKLNPLLHTWSLAVEEHFYLLLPLLFLAIWRFGRRAVRLAVLLVLVVSLGMSAIFVGRYGDEVFYFSPFRVWELAAGSVLAVFQVPLLRQRAEREVIAVIAMAMILIPCFVYGKTTIFPGPAAIPPVLGSALLIHVGTSGGSSITRMLSIRLFLFFGLISYSLYLWHWPLVVFAKFAFGWDGQGGSVGWALVPVSIVLASLSWRFVERPFRGHSTAKERTPWRATMLATGSAAVLAAGLVVVVAGGFPARFGPGVQELDKERTASIPYIECDGRAVTSAAPGDWCVIGITRDATRASILIWGDSHALAWAPAFEKALKDLKLTAIYAPTSACPPMFGVLNKTKPRCTPQSRNIENYLSQASNIRLVVLSSSWTPYFDDYGAYQLLDAKGAENNSIVAGRSLSATVDELLHDRHAVLILGPVPGAPADVPLARIAHEINGVPLPSPRTRTSFRQANAALFSSLEHISAAGRATVVDVLPWFCGQVRCDYVFDGQSRYRDGHHLSVQGALAFSNRIEDAFSGALASSANGAR